MNSRTPYESSTDWSQSGVLPVRIFMATGFVAARLRNVVIVAQSSVAERDHLKRLSVALSDVASRYADSVGISMVMGPDVPAPTGPARESLMKQLRDTAEGVAARSIVVLGDSPKTTMLRGFLGTQGLASTPPTKVHATVRECSAWLAERLPDSTSDFEHTLASAIRFVAREVVYDV